MIDTSRVAVRQIKSEMEGLFARCAVKTGEVIFLEEFLVYESAAAKDDYIPLIVRLAVRLHVENHFERLLDLGMRPECWTLGVDPQDAIWLWKLVGSGRISADRMRDAYFLAAAYNVRCVTVLRTGIDELSIVDRAVIAPLACKANHSCAPNASWWHPSTVEDVRKRLIGMVALRDIAAGEEIVYSYCRDKGRDLSNESRVESEAADSFLALESSSRKFILRQLYGFECNCLRCIRSE